MKDLIERLRVNGVHTLLAQFTDIHGVAKGKLVPLTHFDELLTDGAGFAGPSIPGTGLPPSCAAALYDQPTMSSSARGSPTQSIATSTPRPPVAALAAARGSSSVRCTACAPNEAPAQLRSCCFDAHGLVS
jgi:hypothetical protein